MICNMLSIDEILKQYEQTRLANRRLRDMRRDEVYAKIPRIREIDSAAPLSYINAAKMRILGQDTDGSKLSSTGAANRKLQAEKEALLVEAGYPADYLDRIYTCSKCQDMAYIDGKRCECFTERIKSALLLQSNLKNVLQKENFDTFSTDYYSREVPEGKTYSPYDNICGVLAKSKKFVQSFEEKDIERGSILIYGETGLGKTFLTNCIAKELLDLGHSVLYLSANEIFESIISGYILNKKTEYEDLYKLVYSTELLIIDDLGTEFTNNFVCTQLFEIINQRGNSGLSTIISTNLTMKQLSDRYSERIMSRMIADYTVFNIYGANIRYEKRKKLLT